MSAVQPLEPTPLRTNRAYEFDHIPLLRELLPKQHGRPGLIYAQVFVANQRRAEDQGWNRIEGTVTYTITGPSGAIDMVLMGKGKPVAGLGHASGKRRCVVDLAVEQHTGHRVKSIPLVVTNGSTVNAVSEISESPK